MPYEFTVGGRIAKPLAEVFEAVVDPAKLSGYFTTGGAQGRLETGATVTWDFHDFPGAFPVEVVEVIANEKIVLRCDAPTGDTTTVTMTFADTGDGRTLVRIHETGWSNTPVGEKAAFGNCEGWTGMLCALKVFIEHGINLRQGF
ncbi:SRPBCC domain-containing protein [Caulobacter vibrioides]|uniref:SRPBCC domain-containing protein n=1 Tax=Caulobacter vibrioides TaxID=155892 RepID=UPI000BB4E658|nr:SRPBCC domain-containing protein [Caulobacter vibrioides]ATC23153.1 ATPase [Caulobacter vibrioides]PLR13174.1 ATPase [Caulobacter vibrioides]